MRLKKCFFIIILSCLIASCSLVKTAYNNAPELAFWWLDDYFSFTQAQKITLMPALQKLHQWHRQDQLPSYITLLQEIQTSLASEQISASQACEKLDAIKLSIRTIQTESVPIIVEIAPMLNDKQLNRFQTKLSKRAEKWKSEWWQETAEDQLKVRLEKTEDFAEKVYGSLSEAQYELLKQSLKNSSFNPTISYQEIIRRNEDAFQILTTLQKDKLTAEEKTQLVKKDFERIQKSPNQDYQTYSETVAKNSCETIANLHATTSAKQKLHAKNWLQDYINQITALQIKSQ